MFSEYNFNGIIVRINNAGIGIELLVYTESMKYIAPHNWKNANVMQAIGLALLEHSKTLEEDTEKYRPFDFLV